MKRSTERNPIPPKTRQAVWERSGHLCEAGCNRLASHIHHRKLRSQGGTNELVNLLHLCGGCHSRAHNNPADSYERGLLVRSTDLPALIPVRPYSVPGVFGSNQ